MYFFNQGQALEQYYISIRNTIQLRANSHVDQFYVEACRSILPWGKEWHSPRWASRDVKSLFKGEYRAEGLEVFLVQVENFTC